MSAFYLLGVLTLWGWLTWLLWQTGRRFLRFGFAHSSLRLVLLAVAALAWFGGSFWEAGGKKLYWDAKVREMCAIDGGVMVFETVELPGEMFDRWGNVGLKNKNYAEPIDKFYYESDQFIIRGGDPQITKYVTRVVRRSDEKILGVSIRYGRGGGDFPGPWHPSSYSCPSIQDSSGKLESDIFRKRSQ